VTRAGRIAFVSERAAHWLKEWGANGKLPKPLARWLADEAGEPICWKGNDHNVIVRRAGRNRKGSIALILREESNTLLSLTEQETTVLRWMSYGKTDPEIAGFEKMKLGTVKKYVKRILDALGTYKRAAAASAYERLMSGRVE
jgi:DNA-binding CsgD family transcriptional regulator